MGWEEAGAALGPDWALFCTVTAAVTVAGFFVNAYSFATNSRPWQPLIGSPRFVCVVNCFVVPCLFIPCAVATYLSNGSFAESLEHEPTGAGREWQIIMLGLMSGYVLKDMYWYCDPKYFRVHHLGLINAHHISCFVGIVLWMYDMPKLGTLQFTVGLAVLETGSLASNTAALFPGSDLLRHVYVLVMSGSNLWALIAWLQFAYVNPLNLTSLYVGVANVILVYLRQKSVWKFLKGVWASPKYKCPSWGFL